MTMGNEECKRKREVRVEEEESCLPMTGEEV